MACTCPSTRRTTPYSCNTEGQEDYSNEGDRKHDCEAVRMGVVGGGRVVVMRRHDTMGRSRNGR